MDELKRRLRTEWTKLDHVVIAAAIRQWRRRQLAITFGGFLFTVQRLINSMLHCFGVFVILQTSRLTYFLSYVLLALSAATSASPHQSVNSRLYYNVTF